MAVREHYTPHVSASLHLHRKTAGRRVGFLGRTRPGAVVVRPEELCRPEFREPLAERKMGRPLRTLSVV